jgi:Flp pilus assembly protein TadD
MSDRAFYIWIGLISAGILAIVGATVYFALNLSSGFGQSTGNVQQPQCQTFPETGKTVCYGFLKYWTDHGAVKRQGFPISGEFQEVSDINGKPYTVQYFERAVYEYHPENQPPYDVLLSLLGTIQYKARYPKGVPELEELDTLPPEMKPEGGALFPQTGKEVRGIFLNYWLDNGGPLQYGYPISNAFVERSQLDGVERIVQYFERSIFEFHPENAPADYVQIALSGRFQFESKYADGDPSIATATPAITTTVRANVAPTREAMAVPTSALADPELDRLIAAIAESPDNLDRHLALARWYKERKLFDEATSEMEAVVAHYPENIPSRHLLGDMYQAAGQPDKALLAWEQARDLAPNNPAARTKLGIAFNVRQRFDDAIKEFQEAVKIERGFVEAWYQMGIAYESKGDMDRARESYQGAIDSSSGPNTWSDQARERLDKLK